MLFTGQSLVTGRSANGQVITPTALNPQVVLMPNGGVRTLGADQDAPVSLGVLLDRARVRDYVDLVEADAGLAGQTMAATLGKYLAAAMPSTGFIMANCGLGASPFAQRTVGTVVWRNILLQVERVATFCLMRGLPLRVVVVDVDGESDAGTAKAPWMATKLAYWDDLNAAVRGIAGPVMSQDIIIATDQMGAGAGGGVALAQLQLAIDNPTKFLCVGPKYHHTPVDGIHIDALSQAIRGAEFGRVLKRRLVDGVSVLPPYLGPATISGTTVTAPFLGEMTGGMIVETALISDPEAPYAKGVSFHQTGGNSVGVSSASIVAGNLVAELSAVPTGTAPYLGVARRPFPTGVGPTVGLRACFRDQATEVFDINGDNYPMYRFPAHWETPITAE